MCGWTSGLTLLYLEEGNNQLETKLIDYCNSGDSSYGGKDQVVGYHAIALIEKKQKTESKSEAKNEFSFTDEEKNQLFTIARNSIQSMLFDNKRIVIDGKTIPEKLKMQMGAFVTLKIDGALRGCIGRFISSDPLYEVVQASALSSAFEDPRFSPLTKEEFKKTDIEITVLGPLRKINNINEIILGKHGIYIKKDFRSGTMLPQVATENGWTVEEFLGYTSRDKAGLGWDGWKDAEIFIYDGVVLEDNKK
jgi:AmmeMemoRadiSam system protein A